jgi:hypothetical protein
MQVDQDTDPIPPRSLDRSGNPLPCAAVKVGMWLVVGALDDFWQRTNEVVVSNLEVSTSKADPIRVFLRTSGAGGIEKCLCGILALGKTVAQLTASKLTASKLTASNAASNAASDAPSSAQRSTTIVLRPPQHHSIHGLKLRLDHSQAGARC